MMKIPFNNKPTTPTTAGLTEGRHVGTVIQIAGLGVQPGYNHDDPSYDGIGVVVQVGECQIAKRMRISDSTRSALHDFLYAALPDPDAFEGDDPLPLTLGRTVAIEVSVRERFSDLRSFHRPEAFELAAAPTVPATDLLLLDGPESLKGEEGKSLFMKVHRDIRNWWGKRVRGQS